MRDPYHAIVDRMRTVDTSDPGKCHEWPGAQAGVGYRERRGYGYITFRRRNFRVHRVVLEQKLGRPLAEGMYALHTCDNPPCVNTEHLYEGDQKRNLSDAKERGRLNPPRGERHPHAKLTAVQVEAIRRDPRSSRAIAEDYPIGKTQVAAIRRGQKWRATDHKTLDTDCVAD